MSSETEEDKAVKDLIRSHVMDYAERVVDGTANEAQRESVVRDLADAFKQWHQMEVDSRKMLETEEGRAELGRIKNKLVQTLRDYGEEHATENPTWAGSVQESKERCAHPTFGQRR